MRALLAAKADGHTLMMINTGLIGAEALLGQFSTRDAVTPITLVAEGRLVLVTGAGGPSSLSALLQRARREPGATSYPSLGLGSAEHLVGAAMCNRAGIEMLHVPFRGGMETVQAMLNGQFDCGFIIAQLVAPFIRLGKLNGLAVLSPRRPGHPPGRPDVGELGLPLRDLSIWAGIAAPAGTPSAIVRRLHREIVEAMSATSWARIANAGSDPAASASPEEFARRIDDDLAWLREVIAANGIRPER